MDRTCLACGKSLADAHPRRRYCDNGDVCKIRFHRGARADANDRTPAKKTRAKAKKKPAKKTRAKAKPARPAEPEGIQSTEAATLMALAEASKLGTPGGQAAMVLARRIDQSHLDTGSGLASMVKRLQETLEALTSDVSETDELDELRRRREEKQRAAASS